ncbi:MAG: S41 family peptidase [Niabella sp.]
MRTLLYYKCCFFSIILWLVFSGCKKEADNPFAGVPTTGTRMQFTLDSIFLYASQVYLWREALPSYTAFAPRERYGSVSPELSAFQQELYDITQIPVNEATGLPYEYSGTATARYSFMEAASSTEQGTAAVAGLSNYTIADTVLESAGAQTGYLLLSAFPSLTLCQQELVAAFTSFAQAGVTSLIINLSSNGGGYVATAQYLADLIATADMNEKTMFSESYNSLMQGGGASLLQYQPYLDAAGNTVPYNGRTATMADVDYSEAGNTYIFSKKGSLGTVKNVYFIVSGSTASAAEMLISVLKPYMNVFLIGQKTYGKPVGFFALDIDVYSVYLSSFVIKNANGWYDYFDGMQPDIVLTDMTVALDTALRLIAGTYNEAAVQQFSRQMPVTEKIAAPLLLENRRKLR